jgi:hypothetical protein
MKPAKLSEVKEGSLVELDDSFACRSAGEVEVKADKLGQLFFTCGEGRHYLLGQANADGTLEGIFWRGRDV